MVVSLRGDMHGLTTRKSKYFEVWFRTTHSSRENDKLNPYLQRTPHLNCGRIKFLGAYLRCPELSFNEL